MLRIRPQVLQSESHMGERVQLAFEPPPSSQVPGLFRLLNDSFQAQRVRLLRIRVSIFGMASRFVHGEVILGRMRSQPFHFHQRHNGGDHSPRTGKQLLVGCESHNSQLFSPTRARPNLGGFWISLLVLFVSSDDKLRGGSNCHGKTRFAKPMAMNQPQEEHRLVSLPSLIPFA